jgi:hypothetical protein
VRVEEMPSFEIDETLETAVAEKRKDILQRIAITNFQLRNILQQKSSKIDPTGEFVPYCLMMANQNDQTMKELFNEFESYQISKL